METIGINRILLEILYSLRNLNDVITNYQQAPVVPVAEEEWLHEREAMKILKSSRKSLYNYRRTNVLVTKVIGRIPVYSKSSVNQLAVKLGV